VEGMKYLLLVATMFTGCTTYEQTSTGDHVKYFTMAHNTDVTFYYQNGQPRAHWGDNNNVAVWDAAGRFVGNIGAAAAEVLIAHGAATAVAHGSSNGVQLLAAAVPPTTQHVVTRATNRATPIPLH